MKLADWLKKFPEVRLATKADNEGLLDCFAKAPMKGEGWQLFYDRSPDYFAFLRCHTENIFVFFVKGSSGIEGTGSLLIRPGFVGGERCTVGYLGDLRVTNIRRWGKLWRDFFKSLLADAPKIEELMGCRHFYTAVMAENQSARNALTRSKRAPGYHLLHEYQMVNVIAKKWLELTSNYQIEYGCTANKEELCDFLEAQFVVRDFGYTFDKSHNELDFRARTWRDFSLNDCLLVRDSFGVLRGCMALWSPHKYKRLVLRHLPWGMRLGFHMMSWLVPWPKQGEELRCLYGTFFQVDDTLSEEKRQQVAQLLIDQGLKKARLTGHHVFSIAEFDSQNWHMALKNFICSKTPLQLYVVDPLNETMPRLARRRDPGFEIGLV